MDFRAWQAEYNTGLDDILVSDQEALAESIALAMWQYLSGLERIGYGVFKSEQPKPLGFCICGRTEDEHGFRDEWTSLPHLTGEPCTCYQCRDVDQTR